MAIVTGDRYLECLVKFVEQQAGPLLEGTTVLKLNPVGLHYVQSRIDALAELESLLAGAPVDYLRAYILDLGDHRALEQLRRILRLLTSLKVVSVLPPPARDPTPLSLLLFGRLKVLELRGCDLSTSAARGLLELRHTLEKIICHNSTDALRHVFASRIVEIKDSSQWNRLQFISCACNNLVLMDESLQLLPAVETLDLSRNKFAKVDNLRKCTKLKHLDLGFNHLRTTAALSEVSCHIVKLVLRNNALTSLRGLENLKSVEGLDLSYNIISNFSEIEILASLPYLWNLWLEGNPLCCARWYRAQVFSYFINPDKLALDERRISAREFWKRQIINASRQKRPASFGFYSPAKEDAGEDGSINVKKKKSSRLACIESDGQAVCVGSDFESASCENEIRSREEKILSDDEYEIVDLMNRVEFMKKQRPIFWLHEFEEWMDQASDNFLEHSRSGATDDHGEIIHMKIKARQQHFGESSKCLSESVQALRDDSSSNILESVTSSDLSGNMHSHQHFDQIDEAASRILPDSIGGNCTHLMGKMEPRQEHPRSRSLESVSYRSKCQKSQSRTVSSHGDQMAKPFTAIGDILDPHSLSIYPASPPHYQQDILKRRHNLVEEILQLSSESFSVTSSDSASSDDGDHLCARPLVPGQDQSLGMDVDMGSAKNYFGDKYNGLGLLQVSENDTPALDFLSETASSSQKELLSDQDPPCCGSSGVNDSEFPYSSSQSAEVVERKKCRRKPKRREIFLPDATDVCNNEPSQTLNGVRDACKGDHESEEVKLSNDGKCYRELTRDGALKPLAGSKQSSLVTDHVVQNYFILNLADSSVDETCRQYVHCDCLFEQELRCGEVALILSSQDKLFVLEIDVEYDGSGTFLRRMGCHRLDEVKEVTVGMSLQVVRVYIEGNMSYLFITKCIKKSKQILCALHIFNNTFSLRSIEQIQAELFKKQIFRGYEVCMFQYSMVLFWRSDNKAESGLSRSLFVAGEHLFVCVEDIRKFSFLSEDLFSSPYFTLDSSCHVGDVTEMVIDTRESWCVSLALKSATMGEVEQVIANDKKTTTSGPLSWKLMWVSESSLLKFAALMKALHSGTTASPLLVRCIH